MACTRTLGRSELPELPLSLRGLLWMPCINDVGGRAGSEDPLGSPRSTRGLGLQGPSEAQRIATWSWSRVQPSAKVSRAGSSTLVPGCTFSGGGGRSSCLTFGMQHMKSSDSSPLDSSRRGLASSRSAVTSPSSGGRRPSWTLALCASGMLAGLLGKRSKSPPSLVPPDDRRVCVGCTARVLLLVSPSAVPVMMCRGTCMFSTHLIIRSGLPEKTNAGNIASVIITTSLAHCGHGRSVSTRPRCAKKAASRRWRRPRLIYCMECSRNGWMASSSFMNSLTGQSSSSM
mmetsp:Transcript_46815/g.133535  ORF Transcript_46815/g.133535 Transcript_46815/m.133535 type:complete len:287 (+) Transcript_46815:474-1334(+)